MRRLSGDRGAVAVLVALLIVPLLACTALVVDIGAVYVEKRQLADAARKQEEYEAYIAKIGLAAAKIEENAFDHALAEIAE